jgi:hypothetical protein
MILLTSTSDLIRVVTGSAGTVKVHASWVDNLGGVITPGRTNTASITTATTTTVVASPAASTQRNLKFLSVRNDDASISNLVTVHHTDGTTVTPLWQGTLLAGEAVTFAEGASWQYMDSSGAVKPSTIKLDAWVRVTADVTNATVSFADVTGLSVNVVANKNYMFEAELIHQTNASTTGAQFGIGGVSMTTMIAGIISVVTPSATAAVLSSGVATAINTAASVETTGPGAVNAPARLTGAFTPSASGTFAVRCASEVAVAGGLVIKAGSWLHVRELDN